MKQSHNSSAGAAANLKQDSQEWAPQRPKLRYRIMVGWSREAPEVLWLTNSLEYANELAIHIQAQLAKRGRVNKVWIEQWTGENRHKPWCKLELPKPTNGSAIFNGAGKAHRMALKPGDRVEAVLLAERTRRGGWRAQLQGSDLAGPITNCNLLPAEVSVGQVLTLRIGSISEDRKLIHFQWDAKLS